MLPDYNDDLQADFAFTQLPGRTYRIDFNTNTITGSLDGIEAVKQAIFLILSSERTQYEIYSWNYGVEINRLIGQPPELVQARLENTITDALMQDDRIMSVLGFEFTQEGHKTHVTFMVGTSEGEIETGWTFDV